MIKLNKRDIATVGIVGILIIAAVACRIATKMHLPQEMLFALIRSAIYIGLFTAWGISVKKRIILTQVKRYFIAISLLTIFWMLVRTLKYTFAVTAVQARYLWYLYYLPQLFMPLLLLLIAFSLRKPETYRLPKRTMLLYIPSAIFFSWCLPMICTGWYLSFPNNRGRTTAIHMHQCFIFLHYGNIFAELPL